MLKIRLMRIGAKKRPFYRVVAVDERQKRTGAYIELLGTYNPLTEPHEIKLKQDRIDYWIKQGAQMSDGFLRIIGKAPKRPPRKPKKEKKEAPAPAQVAAETLPAEAPAKSDLAPAEEPAQAEEQPAEVSATEENEAEQVAEATEVKSEEAPSVIPTPSEAEGEGSSTSTDSPATEDSSGPMAHQNDKEAITMEPEAPRNDEMEKETKDEGSA